MFQLTLSKLNKKDLHENLQQKRLPSSSYQEAIKISKNKMTQPTTIKIIDPDNIRSWFLQSVLQLNTIPGLPMALIYSKPSKADPQFQKVIRRSLDEQEEPTERTAELFGLLKGARKTWDASENNLKAYLLTAAGKDEALQRLAIDTSMSSFQTFKQILKDHDKTSPDNVIALRKKLYDIELKNTMTLTDLLSKIEKNMSEIAAAGGEVNMTEGAQIALRIAKFDDRFKTAVAAHIAQNEKDKVSAEWMTTKTYLQQLDRTTEAPGFETSQDKIMMTTENSKNPLCHRCGVPHAYGKHVKRSGSGRNKKNSGRGSSSRDRHSREGQLRSSSNSTGGSGNEDLREAVKTLTAALTTANSNFSRDRNNSRNYDREGRNCNFCHRFGHTEDRCFNNPKSSEYKGKRGRYQDSGSRAYLANGDKDDSRREYYDALARVNRRKVEDNSFDAFVLWMRPEPSASTRICALSTTLADDRNPFIFVLDTAATRVFVWASKHKLIASRMISQDVQTAGAGRLQTVREGVLGTVGVMGMSDELQRQLLGTETLMSFHGYKINLNGLGAFIYNPESSLTGRPVGPFLAKYKQGLIIVDIRNIPEFWIQDSVRHFRPVKYDEALVHTEEPNRPVPMSEAWPSVAAELGLDERTQA
jgi:hypothetical protein